MADVALIIDCLDKIAAAGYHSVHDGPPPSRKTGHQLSFETLQGSARQVAAILRQNPNPNVDMKENISTLFDAMNKIVSSYVQKTDGTRNILIWFNEAKVEWGLLLAGK
ncbi:MAG TPA: hypothetical protein VNQ78_06270 [Paracoccus sp. (in: a-proteobacteria)]|uniref:hypothetical protein n=1 Tax=Paracoccus sp. TaxID=267 RepID=UPI002C9B0427|nr:hypothetical protein [Paracoccus sp. (in: a-proteobacteria)]HWL56268.1 hypothetical protein [Paracoccus sp. (in: a-proteobacteria)]